MFTKHLKPLLLLICTLSAAPIFAGGSAIFFCENTSESAAQKWAEEAQLSIIAFMEYENALLVNEEWDYGTNSSAVCFTSKFRTMENHFAFSRNELILRILPNQGNAFQQFLELKNISEAVKHPFIPNQYLLKNVAENETELKQMKAELKKQNWLRAVQINMVHTLSVNAVDDPFYDRQWSIENTGIPLQGNGSIGADMSVDSAWTITTGDSTIRIVILDSGIDTLHEDLIDNILPGYDAFASDTQDTKGYPTPNYSSDGHGTACAGIAAAAGNNSLGIAGIAYSSKLVPVRIFYYKDYGSGIGVQPSTNSNALIGGSAYAWRQANGDIMSTSAGLNNLFISFLAIDTEVMDIEINDAFENARDGKGIAMFFSSGNDDSEVLWPAKLWNTIAVGASSMCDERKSPDDCSTEAWGSNYGATLDIVAPGIKIASTDMSGSNGYSPNDYTFTFGGTSASCPNAAGVGALILAANPDLHARDVKAILNLSAEKVLPYTYDSIFEHGAWNAEMGYGRINAYEAVKMAKTYNSTVGIKNPNSQSQEATMRVYPNPNNGSFFIENLDAEWIKLKIYNIEGREIQDRKLGPNAKENIQLANGIYFIGSYKQSGLSNMQKLVVY